MFEASKTPLLVWVKALFYVMQGKRGISAQELQRHLGLKSYGRGGILQKIRTALQQRDDGYELSTGVIELDGATFGRREAGNQGDALVAIETITWVDQWAEPPKGSMQAQVIINPCVIFTLPKGAYSRVTVDLRNKNSQHSVSLNLPS